MLFPAKPKTPDSKQNHLNMSTSSQTTLDLQHSSNTYIPLKDYKSDEDACGTSTHNLPSQGNAFELEYNSMNWRRQNEPSTSVQKWSFGAIHDSTIFTGNGIDPRNINPMFSVSASTGTSDHEFAHITNCVSEKYTHQRLNPDANLDSFGSLSCEGSPVSWIDKSSSLNDATEYNFSDNLQDSFRIDPEFIPNAVIEEKTPYNKLLFQCLADAPDNELCLKDIYAWFRENTTKGSDPDDKGWQNSIRHNLSMNQAFRRGARSDKNKTERNMWCLTEDALKNGIEPTTRYRRSDRACSRSRPAGCQRPFTSIRNVRTSKRLSDKKIGSSSAPTTPSNSLLQTPESQHCDTPASLQNNISERYRNVGPYYQSIAGTSSPLPIGAQVVSEPHSLNSTSFFDTGFQVSDLPLQNRQYDPHSFSQLYHEQQGRVSHFPASHRVDELVFGTPPLTESSYPSPQAGHQSQPQDTTLAYGTQPNAHALLSSPWDETNFQRLQSSCTYPRQQFRLDFDTSQLDSNNLGDPQSVLKSAPGAPLFYNSDREEDMAFFRDDIDDCSLDGIGQNEATVGQADLAEASLEPVLVPAKRFA